MIGREGLPRRVPGGALDGLSTPADQSTDRGPWRAGGADTERVWAFVDAVLGLHQVLADRFIPMCSCGLPARHCPIVKAEHDVLGIAMPFQFGPLARPPYYEV